MKHYYSYDVIDDALCLMLDDALCIIDNTFCAMSNALCAINDKLIKHCVTDPIVDRKQQGKISAVNISYTGFFLHPYMIHRHMSIFIKLAIPNLKCKLIFIE